MVKKAFRQLKKRKFTSGILALVIIGGGYFAYGKIFKSDGAIRYATAEVQKGTLIVSISGSGQVSASHQLDIKPKASGDITAVYAKVGQEVGAGKVLAAIDASDAERAVRDAETSLETAKLELDKILEPVDELALLQSEHSLAQAKESKQKAEDNLEKAYEDGFNAVANAFLDLPDTMTGLSDMLFTGAATLSGSGQWNIDYYAGTAQTYDEKAATYKENTRLAYQKARTAYDTNFSNYKSITRFADRDAIESLLEETYDTAKDISDAVKNATNLIQFYKEKLTEHGLKPNALSDTHLATLATYTGKTNSALSNLLSIKRSIEDYKDAIVNAQRSIEEKELSLKKIKEGPDDLDIRAKKIAVQLKEDALATARETLADHYVRAPFAGIIAKVDAKKGDTASAGTAIATIVTKQKIAEISMNEIDVAQIKAGQKTTLAFDAVPDLTITGQVAEVDAVGTVSQGVVTYTVKIGFDTQDDRIKTAMSVSAAIITEAKPNVLLVPNSAVKSQNQRKYVEVPNGKHVESTATANIGGGVILKSAPLERRVKTGASNDEFTEITSGLEEGDVVITRTISPSSAQTGTSEGQNSLFRVPGAGGGGAGGFRAK